MSDFRAMIEDFAEIFYIRREPRRAFEKYVADEYVQHSPHLLDGREAALAMLEPLFGRDGASFEVKRIIVDEPFAAIHLLGRPDPGLPGKAVADFYRVKGGKIVEHWDVVQILEAERRNPRESV